MTTVFDKMQRLLLKYKGKLEYADFVIFRNFIDAVHDLQHKEGTHRIDSFIQEKILASALESVWRKL
jgi:hypothetical protein